MTFLTFPYRTLSLMLCMLSLMNLPAQPPVDSLQLALQRARAHVTAYRAEALSASQPGKALRLLEYAYTQSPGPDPTLDRILGRVYQGSGLRGSYAPQGFRIDLAVFAPDGKHLFLGSNQNGKRKGLLLDAQTGRRVQSFAGEYGEFDRVAFSPDGRYLLSSSYVYGLLLWSVAEGKVVKKFSGQKEVHTLAFSPDGAYLLAAGTNDKQAWLWEVESGKKVATFGGFPTSSLGMHFSPDGKQLAIGSTGKWGVWEVESQNQLFSLKRKSPFLRKLLFVPGQAYLLSLYSDGTTGWIDRRSGKERPEPFLLPIKVKDACFSPDGRYLLVEDPSGKASVWHFSVNPYQNPRAALAKRLGERAGALQSACFSPDGNQVLSGRGTPRVQMWDLRSGAERLLFSGTGSRKYFSPDVRRMVLKPRSGALQLFSLPDARPISLDSLPPTPFQEGYFNEGRLLGLTETGQLYLWDPKNGALQSHFSLLPQQQGLPSLLPGGRLLSSRKDRDTLVLWDVSRGVPLRFFGSRSLQLSPRGRWLVVGESEGLSLWKVTYQEGQVPLFERKGLLGEAGDKPLAFSPDGRYLVTAQTGRAAGLWEVETREKRASLSGHRDEVVRARFSADGAYLLTGCYLPPGNAALEQIVRQQSGSQDNVLLWQVGDSVRQLLSLARPLHAMRFSPDSRHLLMGGWTGEAYLLDLSSLEWVQTLGGHQGMVDFAVFSHDGKTVLTGGQDSQVQLWSYRDPDGKLALHHPYYRQAITPSLGPSARLSPDGQLLYYRGRDGKVLVRDIPDPMAIRRWLRRAPLPALSEEEKEE